jgi:hypothetical protein
MASTDEPSRRQHAMEGLPSDVRLNKTGRMTTGLHTHAARMRQAMTGNTFHLDQRTGRLSTRRVTHFAMELTKKFPRETVIPVNMFH